MKPRKSISLLLVLALLISVLLAGCTSKEETPAGANEGKKEPTTKTEGPMDIEVVGVGWGATPPSGDADFIKKGIDEALNIDIRLNLFGSMDDYINQINIRMAGGDFPDLLQVDRVLLKEYVKNGLLLDLTPYLDELQPVVDFIGEETLLKGTIDGSVYATVKAPQIPYNSYWVRKDWLDNLNLEAPTTLEELYAVAEAFTKNDPNQNGNNDTYGLTGNQFGTFAPIFGAFGVGMPGTFYLKDGELVNSYYDPDMKEALAFINKMIKAGLVDPEIISNSGLQHQQKAFQGQAGILYIDWPNMTKPEFVEQMKAVNEDANWIQIEPIKGPGGQFDGTWDIGAAGAMYAIPKALEKDPERLQKVFDLLNYVSEGEGSLLVQYGVEGTHFNLEGDVAVLTDLGNQELGYIWLYQLTGRPELPYLAARFTYAADEIDFAANLPRIEVFNGYVDVPDGYNPGDANRFTEEELVKFMYGNRSLDEYDKFLETLSTTFNYQLYQDSAKEQLENLGVIK